MTGRGLVPGALAVVAAATGAAVLTGGDDAYHVDVRLENASGLREGSSVKVGGAKVGRLESFRLGARDEVLARLELDRGRIGHGARVEIRTANLLGEKYVALVPGDLRRPAPSGTTIARARTSYPTDLDQVLSVLDADTRARLGILINEAALALTGRRTDLASLLGQLPPGMASARRLLEEVVAENDALVSAVAHSDDLVTRFSRERRTLGRVVAGAGRTFEGLSEREAELRDMTARVAPTLRTLQAFLGDLRRTSAPLRPAARAISTAATPLEETLDELRPFERAAEPTLRKARDVAPALSRLATGATPVVRRAAPTLARLDGFLRDADPLVRAVDLSIDDTLGVMEGWARSIQARDGISHVFRGRATISTDTLRTMVARLQDPQPARRRGKGRRKPALRPEAKLPDIAEAPAQRPRPKLDLRELPRLEDVPKVIQELPDALLGGLSDQLLPKGAPKDERARPTDALLDFLLEP